MLTLNEIAVELSIASIDAYYWFSEIENLPKWNPSIVNTRKTTKGPLQVGSTFIASDGKKEFNYTVTELIPGKIIKFKEVEHSGFRETLRFRKSDKGTHFLYQHEVPNCLTAKIRSIFSKLFSRQNEEDEKRLILRSIS